MLTFTFGFRTTLLLFWWVRIVATQIGVTFLFPTSGLEFKYLDTVNVTYTSSFGSPLLYTFCLRPDTAAPVLQSTFKTQIVRKVND